MSIVVAVARHVLHQLARARAGAAAATRRATTRATTRCSRCSTLGEGWHNNHHHYQRSARQGFYWWEIDISYYVLKLLEKLRIVWDVEGVPQHVRDEVAAPARSRVEAIAVTSTK